MISGICNLPLVPLRSEPSEKSEMVTQVMFGEIFDLLEEKCGWSKIMLINDHYTGWCTSKMLQILTVEKTDEFLSRKPYITKSPLLICEAFDSENGNLILPAGSRLYFCENDFDKFEVCIPEKKYWKFPGENTSFDSDITNLSKIFLNTPYLWGGKSVLGIDCSGLVQLIFSLLGVSLPRDAAQQALEGVIVSDIVECKVGDLAFFKNPEGRIVHVGIVLENMKILHSSGSVHIDDLDNIGIFSKKLSVYTHMLYQIKRILR